MQPMNQPQMVQSKGPQMTRMAQIAVPRVVPLTGGSIGSTNAGDWGGPAVIGACDTPGSGETISSVSQRYGGEFF
jgi:hypothetical protein